MRWRLCAGVAGLGMLISCTGTRGLSEPVAPAAVAGARGWKSVAIEDERILWHGRVDARKPLLAWSGSGMEFRFRGTAFRLGLRSQDDGSMDPSGANFYNIVVDGKDAGCSSISRAEHEILVEKLKDTLHTVRIEKATEALCGRDKVTYFEVFGDLDSRPVAKRRKIVFFGNSITAGYGIEDSEPTNGFLAQTENASVTYASVAARLLDAEPTRLCISGRGLIRNYDGSKDMLLPDFLEWTSPQDRTPWPVKEEADVVVVEIGTNDFALGDPGEIPFLLAYQGLVNRLLARYPQARIVLLDSPMLTDEWPIDPGTRKPVPSASLLQGYLAQVKGGLAPANRSRVSVLQLAPQGPDVFGYGADYHPNRAQARCNGEELAAHIREVTGW